MRLHEKFDDATRKRIDLRASDVSVGTVNQAKRGAFMDHELRRGLTPSQRKTFFELADASMTGCDMQLSSMIRDAVKFQVLNLTSKTECGFLHASSDIVFCRNVLIYFEKDTRREVLRHLHGMLRPDGYLILGSSEMLGDDQGLFQTKRIGRTVVQVRVG